MQKRGKTAKGTQRWFCPACSVSAVRTRADKRLSADRLWFSRWLTGTKSLSEIACDARVSTRTLQRRFAPLWDEPPPSPPKTPDAVLVLDATSISGKDRVVLIVRSPEAVRHWAVADRENAASWVSACSAVPAPGTAVCDAQKGLLLAIRSCWPETKVQRCVVHVHRQASLWLTQQPKTEAGKELKAVVDALLSVRTRRQKRRWLRRFRKWAAKHAAFLKERTEGEQGPGKRKWWYTHRQLRAVRSLLANALPDLFRYVGHAEIPRTTNHLEGGINSPLQELRRRHRGLSVGRREALAAHYLSKRSRKKPPRNVV
jgi:hypothetical protein